LKKVLVTRPEGPAKDKIAEMIRAKGAEPVFCPMSRIEFLPFTLPSLNVFQAIVFTSGNAVGTIDSDDRLLKSLPCFTVGDATAELAREAGFVSVTSANGYVLALTDRIIERLDPLAGPLLYLKGAETAGDLDSKLSAAGFSVESAVVYRAVWLEKIPENIKFEINHTRLDSATFLSPLAARNFTKLIDGSDTPIDLSLTKAICMSEAVAREINEEAWEGVLTSPKPNLNDFVKLI